MAMAPERVGIGIRRHFTTAGDAPLRRGHLGAARRPDHQLPRRLGRLRAARRRGARSTGRSTPPTSSPRSTSGARWAPPSASRRCARWSTGWSTPSPRGASRTATSSTTDEAEAFRDELKHLVVHPEGGLQLAGVVQHRRGRRAPAGARPASSWPSTTRWTRSSTGTSRRARSSRAARARASTSRRIRSSARAAQGRRHRLGPGELHARRRRLGRHHQVGRQDPAGRQDGHPQRRPPRHRGVHLVQGHRGAQGPGAARRRVRHGPRRQGHHVDPVPERQQLGAGHRRVHAGRGRRRRLGPARGHHRRRSSRRCRPATSSARFAKAAWECADPGMQFDTTINRWHTAANTGRINGSNPCSEYMHLDNSACNLASLNLLKFLGDDDTLRRRGLQGRGRGRVHRPGDPGRQRRLPDRARSPRRPGGSASSASATPTSAPCSWPWACPTTPTRVGPGPAAITALMTGHAYATSARTAARMGPFAGYAENGEPMLDVLGMHRERGRRRSTRSWCPTELLSAAQRGLGRRPSSSAEQLRRAQLAGLRAGPDRHHRPDDGLRHHRHRARPRAGARPRSWWAAAP